MRAAVAVGALAIMLTAAGCARRQTVAVPAPPPGVVHVVQMTSTYSYEPKEIRVSVGDTVEWRNTSPFPHTVTAARNASPLLVRLPTTAQEFDSGRLQPGATYRQRLTVPGVYQYISQTAVGTDMVGTVIVTEP